MTSFNVVIPARFASERLPGKPLRTIAGEPMLQHVHRRAVESDAAAVVIATDDARIKDACHEFGADVSLTAVEHQSGTDRLAEVCEMRGWNDATIVVNLQGDEPLMPPRLIRQCADLLHDNEADMGTLASSVRSQDDLEDPNIVKVVTDDAGYALYFSRAPLPFARSNDSSDLALATARHHHGIYAYRVATLKKIVAAEPSAIERCERLEQLRALSMGLRIRVGNPDVRPGPGVDTAADLAAVEAQLKQPSTL